MSCTDLTCLALACCRLHILEELTFDWHNWARNVLGLKIERDHFYVTNSLIVVLSVVEAKPAVSALAFSAVMLINATFFHVRPFVRTRGRFLTGPITAVILFYPVGMACYWRAGAESASIIGSPVLGSAQMAMPPTRTEGQALFPAGLGLMPVLTGLLQAIETPLPCIGPVEDQKAWKNSPLSKASRRPCA